MIIAADDHEVAGLDRLLALGRANGVSLDAVDGSFIKAKEPHVRAFAALWSPDTGIVESEAFVKTLEHVCRAHDVAIVVGSPLVGAAASADGIELVTPHERIIAATGANRLQTWMRRESRSSSKSASARGRPTAPSTSTSPPSRG